jgi:hypothetical protein
LFAQWAGIYEFNAEDFRIFYNTFHSVFPHVVAFGNIKDETVGKYLVTTTEIILIGSVDETKLDKEVIAEKIKNPETATDMYYIYIDNADELMDLFYFTEEQMEGYGENAPLVTDNNPVLEFSSARTIIQGKHPVLVEYDIKNYLGGKTTND